MLRFVTEDDWDVEFSSRQARPRFSEQQRSLFPVDRSEPIRVNLFSGGLDSFAGNVGVLSEHPDVHYVCVSAIPNHRHEYLQKEQVRSLRTLPSIAYARPCAVLARVGVRSSAGAYSPDSRFCLLTLGVVSALSAGTDSLFLYENGVGAINLPYERTPVGVPNSRSVHPNTLLLVSQLIKALTKKAFKIENPCVFQTKRLRCAHSQSCNAWRAQFPCVFLR